MCGEVRESIIAKKNLIHPALKNHSALILRHLTLYTFIFIADSIMHRAKISKGIISWLFILTTSIIVLSMIIFLAPQVSIRQPIIVKPEADSAKSEIQSQLDLMREYHQDVMITTQWTAIGFATLMALLVSLALYLNTRRIDEEINSNAEKINANMEESKSELSQIIGNQIAEARQQINNTIITKMQGQGEVLASQIDAKIQEARTDLDFLLIVSHLQNAHNEWQDGKGLTTLYIIRDIFEIARPYHTAEDYFMPHRIWDKLIDTMAFAEDMAGKMAKCDPSTLAIWEEIQEMLPKEEKKKGQAIALLLEKKLGT